MMAYPQRLLDAFAEAGADLINIHAECASPLKETLSQIRSLGKRAALTLKPATPAEAAFPYLEQLDMVLVMTVEPGFGGQAFMADMLPKIAALRAEIERRGLCVDIQVDGGINAADGAAGGQKPAQPVAVVGNALFTSSDAPALVRQMQAL